MLADDSERAGHAGTLGANVHLPGDWWTALVDFIAGALPAWRDDPVREPVTGETKLTAQLCARLNSLSRHTPGWDFLQFRREEPDETDGRRSIDLAAAPSGSVIWISGREYSEYQTLLPIECKRLPTPAAADRDEREYLISRFSSTGGIERFKAGHHGAIHDRAAMIGYVQVHDVTYWQRQLAMWIETLAAESAKGWSTEDKIVTVDHNRVERRAALVSRHRRAVGLDPIRIDHLWIEL